MLNHIALYNFKEEVDPSERKVAAVRIKKALEDLKDKIDGTIDISVEILLLESSTADFLLLAKFRDKTALDNFKDSPLLFNVRTQMDMVDKIHTADYVV